MKYVEAKCEAMTYKSKLEKALEDPKLKRQYLDEIARVFNGKKGSNLHWAKIRSIHESYGKTDFKKKVLEYYEEYGLPDDWSTLMLFIDVEKPAHLVCASIKALCGMVCSRSPVEVKGLISKLNILRMTEKNPDIIECAEECIVEIS